MINDLIKLADALDDGGHHSAAEDVDLVIRKIADNRSRSTRHFDIASDEEHADRIIDGICSDTPERRGGQIIQGSPIEFMHPRGSSNPNKWFYYCDENRYSLNGLPKNHSSGWGNVSENSSSSKIRGAWNTLNSEKILWVLLSAGGNSLNGPLDMKSFVSDVSYEPTPGPAPEPEPEPPRESLEDKLSAFANIYRENCNKNISQWERPMDCVKIVKSEKLKQSFKFEGGRAPSDHPLRYPNEAWYVSIYEKNPETGKPTSRFSSLLMVAVWSGDRLDKDYDYYKATFLTNGNINVQDAKSGEAPSRIRNFNNFRMLEDYLKTGVETAAQEFPYPDEEEAQDKRPVRDFLSNLIKRDRDTAGG